MKNSAIVVLEYASRFYVGVVSNPTWKLSLKRQQYIVEFIICCLNQNRYCERYNLAMTMAQVIDRRLKTDYGVLRIKIREVLELHVDYEDLYPGHSNIVESAPQLIEPNIDTLQLLYPNVA